MSLNGSSFECPLCTSQGKKSLVRPLQININDALIGCEDPECCYPFGIDSKSLLIRSNYKTLDSNDHSQVRNPASVISTAFSVSANVGNDTILDDFQLDALLQDSTIQLDDDFCQDFNSFLNCDNQDFARSDISLPTAVQDQSAQPNVSSSLPANLLEFNVPQCNLSSSEVKIPSLLVNLVQKDIHETKRNQPITMSQPSTLVNLDDVIKSRNISDCLTDSVTKNHQVENSRVVSINNKSKSLGEKIFSQRLSSPSSGEAQNVRKTLGDAMKYVDSDACSVDLLIAKNKNKSKRVYPNMKKTKKDLDLKFHF